MESKERKEMREEFREEVEAVKKLDEKSRVAYFIKACEKRFDEIGEGEKKLLDGEKFPFEHFLMNRLMVMAVAVDLVTEEQAMSMVSIEGEETDEPHWDA